MGSSVFHGGASTFLAVAVLAPSKSYTFVSFFRTWVGIVLFGMANGFLLLPVVLSLVGPLGTQKKPEEELAKDEEQVGANTGSGIKDRSSTLMVLGLAGNHSGDKKVAPSAQEL